MKGLRSLHQNVSILKLNSFSQWRILFAFSDTKEFRLFLQISIVIHSPTTVICDLNIIQKNIHLFCVRYFLLHLLQKLFGSELLSNSTCYKVTHMSKIVVTFESQFSKMCLGLICESNWLHIFRVNRKCKLLVNFCLYVKCVGY